MCCFKHRIDHSLKKNVDRDCIPVDMEPIVKEKLPHELSNRTAISFSEWMNVVYSAI